MTRQLSDTVTNDVRNEVRRFLESRPDIGLLDLVHHTSLAESTGRNFLSGHCPGGLEVVNEFKKVLMLARAGDILQPGGGQQKSLVVGDQNRRVRSVRKRATFYETQTVKRIAEVCDFCAENATIGIITSDFGTGKTEGVAAWRRSKGRRAESAVFEFDEFSSSSKTDFVNQLAEMFGVPHSDGNMYTPRAFRDVCEHLSSNPCLLIFDQCETVRARVFQVIRQMWDRSNRSGVGVVILAAPVLLHRLSKSGMADLGALTSRVGIWAPLEGTTRGEMAAIVKQEGVTEIDAAAFDLWWKSTHGSMRRLMRSLDLIKARHAGKQITEKTIAGVAAHLWGMSVEGV